MFQSLSLTPDARAAKTEMRTHIRALKSNYSDLDLKSMSSAVISHLTDLPQWKAAKRVLLYYSLSDEVDTHGLLHDYCLSKTLLLPVVEGDSMDMTIRPYTGPSCLSVGAYGILQPTTPVYEGEIDLAIIPAVAVDREGNRLGHGKGYYDRLLDKLQCPLIAIVFPFQVMSSVPVEAHDHRMDFVVD